MSQSASILVHGNVVQPEFPERLRPRPSNGSFGDRAGFGAFFYGFNTSNWFHFPMPTSMLLSDAQPRLARVFVFYATNDLAVITNLHIYDGKIRIKAFDVMAFSGDHSAAVDDQNSWLIRPPLGVRFGLGLSLQVQFLGLDPANAGNGEIQFASAGAEFAAPEA